MGCPFCLTMLSDGIKDRKKEETMAALDIAEIVWKAMDLEEEKPPVDVCARAAESLILSRWGQVLILAF